MSAAIRPVPLLPLLLLVLAHPLAAQQATELRPSQAPLARTLGAGETHVYEVALGDGRFVAGAVDQQTVDVVVRVLDPDGRVVDVFDEPARGPEWFQFEAPRAGRWRIEVAPFEQGSGRYAVRVDRVEPLAHAPADRVRQTLARWDGTDTPGAAVHVFRGDSVLLSDGWGMANLEYDVPITPSSIFHVASVSKQFTAFALVLLAEQGRLSLDDDVRTHLPELPDFGETITLRHLLNHTSGLRDQWSLWAMAGGRLDDVIRQDDLVRLLVRQRELNFPPGSEYLYSNSGYMLAAEVVERVTGEPFGDWLEANVLTPLGMTDTQVYDDHQRLVPGRTYSYRASEDGDGWEKSVLSYANSGATSLFTTAPDLARWLRNFGSGAVGGRAAVARMGERGILTAGDTIDYALGVSVGDRSGVRCLSHGGADAGYRSYAVYCPALDAGVVVLSNAASFNPGAIAQQAAAAFFDEIRPEPEPEPLAPTDGLQVDRHLLDRYAGDYSTDTGFEFSISRDESTLRARPRGQSAIDLRALSDSTFEATGVEASITFHLDGPGPAPRATLVHDGDTMIARRAAPYAPDRSDLTPLAGRYYSPELETVYTVALEGDTLVARHRRHGDIALDPITPDRFSGDVWFFSQVLFERDDAGAVTGMRVSNGRVRDLLFARMDPSGR